MSLTYQALEDNGGGLHLAIFNSNADCVWFASDFERDPANLRSCVEDLQLDGNIEDWEGGEDNPQALYDDITSHEYGWEIVADSNGLYPERMGAAARKAFQVEDDD